MKYAQHRSTFTNNGEGSKKDPGGSGWFFVFVGIILLVSIVFLVRLGSQNVQNEDHQDEDHQLVTEEGRLEEDQESEVETQDVEDIAIEEIDLVAVDGYDGYGIARRGESGNLFSHVVVATLPALNLGSQYYEGWLVKPGVVQFFSTGEMFPRQDGKWGLVWEVEISREYMGIGDFEKVVITLEDRDGNEAPSAEHVLEGRF